MTADDPAARIAEIRERCEAATPGPWEWGDPDGNGTDSGFLLGDDFPERIAAGDLESSPLGKWVATAWMVEIDVPPEENDGESRAEVFSIVLDRADAAFIAHSRSDVPWLLAEVERIGAERDALQRRVDTLVFEAEELQRQRDGALARVRRRERIIESDARGIASRDEQIAALTAERDELAAIVGAECPIADLSIVESLRVAAAHAGQHAEEMQAAHDALAVEVAELRAAAQQRLEYISGDWDMRCHMCPARSPIGQDLQSEPLQHKPPCILACPNSERGAAIIAAGTRMAEAIDAGLGYVPMKAAADGWRALALAADGEGDGEV